MIQALDFLRNVKDKPEDHGITGEKPHQGSARPHTIHFVERLESQEQICPKNTLHLLMAPVYVDSRSQSNNGAY